MHRLGFFFFGLPKRAVLLMLRDTCLTVEGFSVGKKKKKLFKGVFEIVIL
jgi:hypothetical protein